MARLDAGGVRRGAPRDQQSGLRPVERLGFGAASVVYATVLVWSYAHVESTIFAYVGLIYRPVSSLSVLTSYLLSTLPTLWLSPRADRPSSTTLVVFYALVFVPFVHISPHVLPWPPERIWLLNFFLLGNLLLVSLAVAMPARSVIAPRISQRAFLWSLVLAVLGITLAVAAVNGFRVNLSVADVYVRRHEARDVVGTRSIVGYAMGILGTALMPLTLTLGLRRRSVSLFALGMLAVVAIFSLTGQKSILLTPPLVVSTFLLVRTTPRAFGSMVCLGLTGLVLIGAYSYLHSGNVIVSSVVTYRLLSAPAVNTGRYFEFFSDHPYYYLAAGPLRGLVSSPYEKPMSLMLGDLYSDTAGFNMNSNVWASGFGDAGWVGVVAVSVVVGLLLWLLDNWSRDGDSEVFVTLGSLMGFLLAEMALPTALVTGGVIPMLICLSQLSWRPSATPVAARAA